MNKLRRQELKTLKYKKRLKLIGRLNSDTLANPIGEGYNFTSLKNHSTPCSCFVCSHSKFKRSSSEERKQIIDGVMYHHTYYDEDLEQEFNLIINDV